MRVTSTSPQVSPGKGGAPIGTREWADYLRMGLIADADRLGEDDERFAAAAPARTCADQAATTLAAEPPSAAEGHAAR